MAKKKRKPKYQAKPQKKKGNLSFLLLPLSYFYIELFAWYFLSRSGEFDSAQLWPLAFGGLWAVILPCLLRLLPAKWGRIGYGLTYFFAAVYAGFQTGYYNLFSGMMWLSDFRYAAEGADYASVLFSYPLLWWIGIFGMIGIGAAVLWKFPKWELHWARNLIAAILAAAAVTGAANV